MTQTQNSKILLPLLVPLLIACFLIIGGIIILLSGPLFNWILGTSFCLLGGYVFYNIFEEYKQRQQSGKIVKYDERAMTNQLKAADRSFRFLIIVLLLMILLNSFSLLSNADFVALTGPICAVAIIIYYYKFYRYERRG